MIRQVAARAPLRAAPSTESTARATTAGAAHSVSLWRTFGLGIPLLALNAYWVTMMEIVRYSGHPTTVSLFFNVVFIILVLFAVNALLRRLGLGHWALTRPEIVLIYTMLTIGTALVSHDMIQVLAPELTHPYRFATPENQWESLFFSHLPTWWGVRDEDALRGAYDGGTTLYLPEHYGPWLVPIFWWTTFIVAMVVVTLCLASILRRRWVEEERLSFPIAQIGLQITDESSPLYRDRLMWLGFGISAFIGLVNGFNVLYPMVPPIKTRWVFYDDIMNGIFRDRPWGSLQGTRLSFYPFAIGLGLLLPADLLFSCWFFYLVSRAQRVFGAVVGWDQLPRYPWPDQQGFGGYMGLAVFGLWIGRKYFAEVLRDVFKPQRHDHRDEAVSYRLAFAGLMVGLVYLIGFATRLGMSVAVAIAFFAIYLCLSISVGRIRAELGPPAHDLHNGGPDRFLALAFGVGQNSPLGASNLVAMKLLFWFNRAYRGHPLPPELEAMKMADGTGLSLRMVWMALLFAGVWGTVCGFWAQLHCYYQYGMSAKFEPTAIRAFGSEPFNELRTWLVAPQRPDARALEAMAFGFLFTLALNALRVRLAWFPFHPVGYATSMSWSMNILWMPLLLAWIGKVTVIRYGGVAASQRVLPFAMGLVLGEFVTGSLWTLYGIATHQQSYGFWV